jgi:sugar lactone lactonase YvrE
MESGETKRWVLNEVATGLALSDAGEILVVSPSGLNVFDPTRPELRRLVTPPFSMEGMRFNDCGCDRLGRLWTGTMMNEFDAAGELREVRKNGLYRFDPDLSCHFVRDGFGCPNTFVWTADNRTLLTADSAAGIIFAFDFDLPDGTLGDCRTFANPANLGIPDGSALDAQGDLWNARWGAGCLARFGPEGNLREVVSIPADFVTSCAFGGPDLDTLFVTTARQHVTTRAATNQPPFAGGIFSFKPLVPGIVAPTFKYSQFGD